MTERFYIAYDERANPNNPVAVQDRAIILSVVGVFPGDYAAIKQAKEDCTQHKSFVLISYDEEAVNNGLKNPILVLCKETEEEAWIPLNTGL